MEPFYPHDEDAEDEELDEHGGNTVNSSGEPEEAYEGRPRNLHAIAGWLYDKAVCGNRCHWRHLPAAVALEAPGRGHAGDRSQVLLAITGYLDGGLFRSRRVFTPVFNAAH